MLLRLSRARFSTSRHFTRPLSTSTSSSFVPGTAQLPSEEPFEFTVGPSNGFLPRHPPLDRLPSEFAALESLLNRMPVVLDNGQAGLLAFGQLGPAVDTELPLIPSSTIASASPRLLSALFRDYTFLASAYLLEPCDLSYKASGSYGLGRARLPAVIARPLVQVAERLKAKPFMEYAMSYALYNYALLSPSAPPTYDNLRLIRKLHGGQSEAGFILVHVAMVAHTPGMVKAVLDCLSSAENDDVMGVRNSLDALLTSLVAINDVMETMWTRSAPSDYLKLRTFIMGVKDQSMFPNGVVYEGVDDVGGDVTPRYYRGESGANDSIIPTCDSLLQLAFPDNPLTDILKDFRSYRPVNHTAFIGHVQQRADAIGFRSFASRDAPTAVRYLAVLDRVREFRQRHWGFTKEYIIKRTRHPVATGGSPITTWLPNQLAAVLQAMEEVDGGVRERVGRGEVLGKKEQEMLEGIRARYEAQLKILTREVDELSRQFGQAPPDNFAKSGANKTVITATP